MTRPLSLLTLSFILTATAATEDWPRWRGPRGDGTWRAPPLPDRWPAGGPRRVWKQPVGAGYAGLSVADGRLFTLDHRKEPGDEGVVCRDAATGELRWEHRYPVQYGPLGGYANGPRAAPTVHGDRVYALGAVGHLHCLDAASGKVVWENDLVAACKARVPEWGFAAAPLVDGDRVIVTAGADRNGGLIAFDRHTGKQVWGSLSDPAGYGPPVAIETPAGRQLVVWTPEFVHGLNPADGKPLWQVPYKVTYGVAIAPPVYAGGLVFVSGYWEGSKAIRPGQPGRPAGVVWEDRKLCGLMAQPLVRDGLVYVLDKREGLVCVELATGKRLWADHRLTPRARNPHASLVWAGDGGRVLAVNAAGELILARLSRSGYEEQSRAKLLDGGVWGHPAFAGRFVFVRSDGAEQAPHSRGPFEVACFELAPG